MVKRLLLLILCVSALAACVNFRDLTPDEFRTDEFAYKKYEFNEDIKKLAGYLYEYNHSCSPIRQIDINRDKPNDDYASIVFRTPGVLKTSTIAVIDFKRRGNKTYVETYSTSNQGWHRIIEQIMDALKNKGQCK